MVTKHQKIVWAFNCERLCVSLPSSLGNYREILELFSGDLPRLQSRHIVTAQSATRVSTSQFRSIVFLVVQMTGFIIENHGWIPKWWRHCCFMDSVLKHHTAQLRSDHFCRLRKWTAPGNQRQQGMPALVTSCLWGNEMFSRGPEDPECVVEVLAEMLLSPEEDWQGRVLLASFSFWWHLLIHGPVTPGSEYLYHAPFHVSQSVLIPPSPSL